MPRQVTCYDCGSTFAFADRKRCECGEPLWFDVDASDVRWPEPGERDGVWRYADALPSAPSSDSVAEPVGLSPAAGGTPLFRATRLDDYAGCRIHLKHEGQNPTGSFKDRGSAVGISDVVSRGRESGEEVESEAKSELETGTETRWIGTVSHGNMALSVAAHAASAGLECAVFVPADTPEGRLELIARHEPLLVRVRGDYGRLYHDALSLSLPVDVEFVLSDTPLRVAGQKTVAYEICEAFAPSAPDAIVLPASSGGQASAVWKALLELEAAGLLDAEAVPSLFLVQAAACDPIATAYRNGDAAVRPVEREETVAVSIANPDPPSGTRALTAARETGGAVVSVSESAIEDATAELAREAGVSVEPSSAVALAGTRSLSREGAIAPDDDVVLVLTGSGYKERYGFDTGGDVRTVDRADLERELAAVVGE